MSGDPGRGHPEISIANFMPRLRLPLTPAFSHLLFSFSTDLMTSGIDFRKGRFRYSGPASSPEMHTDINGNRSLYPDFCFANSRGKDSRNRLIT